MIVQDYNDFKKLLDERIAEYNDKKEGSKSYEILKFKEYIEQNLSKIDKDIIESPIALEHLYDFIVESVHENYQNSINVNEDGSISLKEYKEFENYPNKKIKSCRSKDIKKLSDAKGKRYILSDYRNCEVVKGDNDINQHETILTYETTTYSLEGLVHEQAYEKLNWSLSGNWNNLDSKILRDTNDMNKPDYSLGFGFRNNFTHEKRVNDYRHAVRGTYFGDEDNIGMYYLEKTDQNNKTMTIYREIPFYMAANLNVHRDGDMINKDDIIIKDDDTPEINREKRNNAKNKFGGSEKGWKMILEDNIPNKLKIYAKNKLKKLEDVNFDR